MKELSPSEPNCGVHASLGRPQSNGISRSFFPVLLILVMNLSITNAVSPKTITVNAIVPQSLRKNETTGFENVVSASFGRFHVAPSSNPEDDQHGSLIVSLYQVHTSLCTAEQLEAARKRKETEKWNPPYGLLVDRNHATSDKDISCTDVQQARHAQALGAAATVLVNPICLCDDSSKCDPDGGPCESSDPVVADDGTGHDVQIPVVMLTKQDGKSIRDALKSSGVTIEMRWRPFRSEKVGVTLWHTPFFYSSLFDTEQKGEDKTAGEWWFNMSIVMNTFGDSVDFRPQYMLLDGDHLNCLENPVCNAACTNGGRYCDASGSFDGVYRVEESLVRKCIWRHVKNSNDHGAQQQWWKYVSYTAEHCPHLRKVDGHECRAPVLKELGIEDMVHNCVADSGGIQGDKRNALLKEELDTQMLFRPQLNPTVTVNQVDLLYAHGRHQHPYLSAASIFEAACNAFLPEHQHASCSVCLSCYDPIFCLSQSEPWSCDARAPPPQQRKKKHHFRNFMLWCIFLGGMAFAGNKYQRFRNEQNLEEFFQNNNDYTLSENLFGND